MQEVGQGEAAIASKEMKAYGRGAGGWIVGEPVGVLEGAERRVIFVGAVFVGLELPGADARVGG